jgi:hypothetical protein
MDVSLVRFGVLEVEGQTYEHDVVIDGGKVSKRHKKPSKRYPQAYGHTPLSADEYLPWHGTDLIIGTGTSGCLPVMDTVFKEGERRRIRVVALPTDQACALLRDRSPGDCHAVLHSTC